MKDGLKIIGVNLDIAWKSPELNFKTIQSELENADADIFLLPEMFPTGFCMDAAEIADENGRVLDWMRRFSAQKNAAVCGSASIKENGRFYNRFYFVKPDGSFDFYDKRHLFSYSGEDEIYAKGSERKIVEYKGARFLLQVCYDLRFPVFSRNNDDYDAILYVANWPESRVGAWLHLLKARAIENLSYVFGLNRIGTDGNNLKYAESSRFYFADGSEISEHSGHLVSAEIDLEKLNTFREKFGFLNDRDAFELL